MALRGASRIRQVPYAGALLLPIFGRRPRTAAVSLWPVARDNPGEMDGRVASPTFVGRVEELQALEAARRRAATTEPAVVLVGGEAGVGKTRLVAELTVRCATTGTRVLRGGCVPVGDGALAEQLRVAVDSGGLTERAKGALMERERLDAREAVTHLRPGGQVIRTKAGRGGRRGRRRPAPPPRRTKPPATQAEPAKGEHCPSPARRLRQGSTTDHGRHRQPPAGGTPLQARRSPQAGLLPPRR
jgi:hypothetical protein